MNGTRESQLIEAANLLMNARRTLTPIADLPEEVRPVSVVEVDYIQKLIEESFGPVGGWKVGAASLEATPAAAPMPARWMGPTGSVLLAANHRVRGLEAEVAFLLGTDLPARETPYSYD